LISIIGFAVAIVLPPCFRFLVSGAVIIAADVAATVRIVLLLLFVVIFVVIALAFADITFVLL
jgi:hypothetical protein